MKKLFRKKFLKLLSVVSFIFFLLGCFKEKSSIKTSNVELQNQEYVNEKKMEKSDLINEHLPPLEYKYEVIINQPGGIVHTQDESYYSVDKNENEEIWGKMVIKELENLSPIPENASDEEIENLLRQFIHIVGAEYEPVETFDKFSRILFEKNEINSSIEKKVFSDDTKNIEGEWEQLDEHLIKRLRDSHHNVLLANSKLKDETVSEINNLYKTFRLASDPNYIKKPLFKFDGVVSAKLFRMGENRSRKIYALYDEELEKRKKQSEEYLKKITSKKGEKVLYLPTKSEVTPSSRYYKEKKERKS